MRLPLVVEAGDRVRDGTGESVGIGKGTVGELMLLEVAPASLDVIQLGGVFWQPFEGEPGARGERLCGQLAGVDWPVVENRDQRPGAFGGAVGGAKPVEQGNEVGGALGGTGMDEQVPVHRINEVAPISWTSMTLLREVSLWPRRIHPMRRSSGAKWSSWFVLDGIRPIWVTNSNPGPRRSETGEPRPIGRTGAGRPSPLLMPA